VQAGRSRHLGGKGVFVRDRPQCERSIVKVLPKFLHRVIRKGRLRLIAPDGYEHVFEGSSPGPEVAVRLTDPKLDWKIPLNPELHATEAIMEGTLVVEDGPEGGTIADLMELVILNRDSLHATGAQRVLQPVRRHLRRFLLSNPVRLARRNNEHHYNVGNDFYRMWLDADMQYTCGYFPKGDETLEEAQTAKKRHIAAKLCLKPGQRVLDMGCGWGGMALYLAAVADVEVHGVTVASDQLAIAVARAEAAGLKDRVRFDLMDYRDVRGRFDRIVSVGMMEHLGPGQIDPMFRQIRDCLTEDGVALVHANSAITPPASTGPFFRKHIFPGGYQQRLSEMTASIERAALWCFDVEVWRRHYARTIQVWRERFGACRAEAEAMYDARFCRMWDLYLAASEKSFTSGTATIVQLQLGRDRDAVPQHRDYIAPAEAALATREPEALPLIRAATASAFGEAPPEAARAAVRG
jgi:cyclopropane-fatty-acyl-phospholipid synthase